MYRLKTVRVGIGDENVGAKKAGRSTCPGLPGLRPASGMRRVALQVRGLRGGLARHRAAVECATVSPIQQGVMLVWTSSASKGLPQKEGMLGSARGLLTI